ncbi:MAG: anthranilate phosphoribosyltransferase [Pseudomonadota bacterium]
MSGLKIFIEKILAKEKLSVDDSSRAFQIIMSGGANPCEISLFLGLLRFKEESYAEILGAVKAMKAKAINIKAPKNTIDNCGTGGDNIGSYNISTAVAFVVAACGVNIAKHGNKAVSSKSGSADIFSNLQININLTPEQSEKCLLDNNICFLMAPNFHPAMRHVAAVRQEIGIKTIFNLLGPLLNPANVKRQLIGVYDKKWLPIFAKILNDFDAEMVWIVCGEDGVDEISVTGDTNICQLKDGQVQEFKINPKDYGIGLYNIDDIKGKDVMHNTREMIRVFEGKKGALCDMILINSAAALLVAGKVDDIKDGINLARNVINDKLVLAKIDNLVSYTKRI